MLSAIILVAALQLNPVFPYSNPLVADVSCQNVVDLISHHQDDGIMEYYQDDLALTVDNFVLIGGTGNLSMVSRDGALLNAVYQECVQHPQLYLGQATAIIYDQEMNIKPQYFPPIFTLNIYNR